MLFLKNNEHIFVQVHVYKNSASQQKVVTEGPFPSLWTPRMNGAHCVSWVLSWEQGEPCGESPEVTASCAGSPGKQLQVAARGPPCVWPLCCNLEGGDCKLLFTLQFLEKHKISYQEKSKFLSRVFTSLCLPKYMDFPICMYVSFFLGSGYFMAFHVFLSILLLCTLYQLKTFLELHVYCKLN